MEKIGILGIGKLGLCFALNLERAGYEVMGVDISPDYIQNINRKTFLSPEPFVSDYLKHSLNFAATTSIAEVLNDDFALLFLAVATPTAEGGGYDHSQIEKIADELIQNGKRKELVDLVVICTTMPGYCDGLAEKLNPFNYRVSYNPEFIAQGSIIHDQLRPDQVLIGEADMDAGEIIENVYKKLCENSPAFCRMSRLSAEICKLATNCFLTTKISFANSIGDLATLAGAEPEKILAAIGADSRVGKKYLNYGFGFGGPCFPRDNRALGKFANETGLDLHISNASDRVNKEHLEFQFQQYLKEYTTEQIINFETVAYKKGTNMIEESQQLALAVKLAKAGRKVWISGSPEIQSEVEKIHPGLFQWRFEE